MIPILLRPLNCASPMDRHGYDGGQHSSNFSSTYSFVWLRWVSVAFISCLLRKISRRYDSEHQNFSFYFPLHSPFIWFDCRFGISTSTINLIFTWEYVSFWCRFCWFHWSRIWNIWSHFRWLQIFQWQLASHWHSTMHSKDCRRSPNVDLLANGMICRKLHWPIPNLMLEIHTHFSILFSDCSLVRPYSRMRESPW